MVHTTKRKLFCLLAACFTIQFASARNLMRSGVRHRDWAEIFSENRGAVAQIFAHRQELNIFEPFRTPDSSMAVGSGVFVSDDGYLLTNFHVISNTGSHGCYVQTPHTGQVRLKLELIGACPQRDVALLRLIPGESLETYFAISGRQQVQSVSFGNSDDVRIAEEIMALGHPDGERDVKIAMGFVKGREVNMYGNSVLQTTAALNPGDSGGPFFNNRGELIGLSVAKRVGAEGFGLIIPISSVQRMFKDLCSVKILHQPRWAFLAVPTSASTREYLKCPEPGLYITKLHGQGILAQAKLQVGDVITAIDGIALDEHGYMNVEWSDIPVPHDDYLQRAPLGIDCPITYYRNGKKGVALARVRQPERQAVDCFYETFEPMPDYEVFAGMVVAQFSLNHLYAANIYGIPVEADLVKYTHETETLGPRVVITSILSTSALQMARVLNPGLQLTLIKKINGLEVNTMAEFRAAILTHRKDPFLTIEVQGGAFIALRLDDVIEEEARLRSELKYEKSAFITQLTA